jgi:hypothetical protein
MLLSAKGGARTRAGSSPRDTIVATLPDPSGFD